MISREGLRDFVRRVLNEKKLTFADVERRAGGAISDSYVAVIATEEIKNITIDKLAALAQGLGVTTAQMFAVACGISLPDQAEFEESEFAELYYKYIELNEKDRKEIRMLVEVLNREIERRLIQSTS